MVTNYPLLNINYSEKNNKKRLPIELELFDNHVDSTQKVVKSRGMLNIVEDNNEYRFSLIKESPGHNERENNISIFGMEKHDEYVLLKTDEKDNNEKYVQLFINKKYIGVYSLKYIDNRNIDRR